MQLFDKHLLESFRLLFRVHVDDLSYMKLSKCLLGLNWPRILNSHHINSARDLIINFKFLIAIFLPTQSCEMVGLRISVWQKPVFVPIADIEFLKTT